MKILIVNQQVLLQLLLLLCVKKAISEFDKTDDQTVRCPLNCTCKPFDKSVVCEKTHRFHIPIPLPNGTKLLGFPKNEFTSLSNTTFTNMKINTTLETLILIDNKIANIKPYTFRNVRNLKKLWLLGNRLKKLQTNTFNGLKNLQELYLCKNFITQIEKNAFFGLENLELLQLWGNQLLGLSPDSFLGLENLLNLALGKSLFFHLPRSNSVLTFFLESIHTKKFSAISA